MQHRRERRGLAVAAVVLAGLALSAPLTAGHAALERLGLLLSLAACLEIAQGFRRRTPASQRAAWIGGGLTLAMGVVLMNAPWVAADALALLLAGWFGLDGVRRLVQTVRALPDRRAAGLAALEAVGDLGVAAGLLLFGDRGTVWAAAIASAYRIFTTAANIAAAPVFDSGDSGTTVVADLGCPDTPRVRTLVHDVEQSETRRVPVDRGWLVAFALTLFAIHLGRSGLDKSALGVLTPAVAVIGDFVVALIAAYVVAIPLQTAMRRLTRGVERRLWSRWAEGDGTAGGWRDRFVAMVLRQRLTQSMRARRARYSIPYAVTRGLQIGLPIAAIIAATAPVFGMSWYFDTENWAAGIWNNWAETRTDTWRAAMIDAAAREPGYDAVGMKAEAGFGLHPDGVGDGDFSFIVIGDTGEGDASQHVLRDSYLDVVQQDRVKFVVISSDVVYPIGAMKDYETKFWLPFKGTHRPVYAIPGNHDWYDALEAFNATFLTPDAARTAMRARIEVDNRLTSTTDDRIEELIRRASWLKGQYDVPTQFQQAPFFQVQTDRFAFIAVDTGVARTVDDAQFAWLHRALDASRGKLTMVLLGHPFYAGGLDTVGEDDESFAAIRRLLHERNVSVIMAGDTHDLEYYAEPSPSGIVHNFVNGGGGAYLSFGTALAWPDRPAIDTWAFYPDNADVVGKIEATTPWWKQPFWWWTRRFNAWPYSPEWLSAMFDVNTAPFFQSFVEVAVERSQNRVRLIPYGIHGRLRWSEFQHAPRLPPPGADPNDEAEWVVEMDGR